MFINIDQFILRVSHAAVLTFHLLTILYRIKKNNK